MTDEVKAAVFGNVGTMITFRVGAVDGEAFEKEFAPYFTMDDIVNLSAYQVYLRLMIDGVGSKPFSAHTLPPVAKPAHSFAQAVIEHSRHTYARPLKEVEKEVAEFYLIGAKPTEERRVEPQRYEQPREKPIPVAHVSKANSYQKTIHDDRGKRQEPRRDHPKVQAEEVANKISDGKPNVSLKDALARAMTEKKIDEKRYEKPAKEEKADEDTFTTSTKKKNEIPEDILRNLIGKV
jgi:hypothetical protein